MEKVINELSIALYGSNDGIDNIKDAINIGDKVTDRDIKKALAFVNEQELANAHSSITFTVRGEPPSSKRPRAVRVGNGIRMYAADGGAQLTLKQEIETQFPSEHIPFEGEVELHLAVFKPMLSSWPVYKRILAELGYMRPEVKPDYDNYSKIITDAMRTIVFKDDSQVVVGNVNLYYSNTPRLEVTVSGRKARMFK